MSLPIKKPKKSKTPNLDRYRKQRPVETRILPEKVSLSQIKKSVREANRGARRFQSFQLDPSSIVILPYKREPEKRILKARIKKAWEAGTWRGDRMTSIDLPLSELSEYHIKTEMMPYYADLAKDAGLLFDQYDIYKAYKQNGAWYVEYIFEGFMQTEWVDR